MEGEGYQIPRPNQDVRVQARNIPPKDLFQTKSSSFTESIEAPHPPHPPPAPPGTAGGISRGSGPAPADVVPLAELCGVGISLEKRPSGCIITQVAAGGPAAAAVATGDMIVRVDGVPVDGKEIQDVVRLIRGRAGTAVTLTIESVEEDIVPAPFQALPFNSKRRSKGVPAVNYGNVYGGGTLPPGYEHLEVLRSNKPYRSPCFSVRNVLIPRRPLNTPPPSPANAPAARSPDPLLGPRPSGPPPPSPANPSAPPPPSPADPSGPPPPSPADHPSPACPPPALAAAPTNPAPAGGASGGAAAAAPPPPVSPAHSLCL